MNIKHGESRKGAWTPEYRAWVNMVTRCHNPKATRYKDWGGRGISVFPEWRNDYAAFLSHVGRRPSAAHSLDRHPNQNGNYEPGNVRWATRQEQGRNVRDNRILEFCGQRRCMTEWANLLGISKATLFSRLVDSGWSVERALSTPVMSHHEIGLAAADGRWGKHNAA